MHTMYALFAADEEETLDVVDDKLSEAFDEHLKDADQPPLKMATVLYPDVFQIEHDSVKLVHCDVCKVGGAYAIWRPGETLGRKRWCLPCFLKTHVHFETES